MNNSPLVGLESPLTLASPVEVVTTIRGREVCSRSDRFFEVLSRVERFRGEVLSIKIKGEFLEESSVDALNVFIGFFGLRRWLRAYQAQPPPTYWKSPHALRFLCAYLNLRTREASHAEK
ncbi:hypothetical protein [Synoicihabitans lomoniglobus]|uniref:Uncharacterized protein n=1 Tax=Synoicihabitans lomoniglobus TaxID=2909285 RepID=A0AAF0I4H5_9BACT|nr:hypothetical protein [Opitutaceae bacterium LMO-M01]WED66838.1 hypothetical protein PXH66_08245 [Opitutaceae bacterium LMO-M01]